MLNSEWLATLLYAVCRIEAGSAGQHAVQMQLHSFFGGGHRGTQQLGLTLGNFAATVLPEVLRQCHLVAGCLFGMQITSSATQTGKGIFPLQKV